MTWTRIDPQTGDPWNPVPDDTTPSFSEATNAVFKKVAGRYADIPSGIVSGATLGYYPAVPTPEDAGMGHKVAAGAAKLAGMGLSLTPVGRGLKAVGMVPKLARLGRVAPIVQGAIEGAETGALYGAARKQEEGETRLGSAAKDAATFGLFGGAGGVVNKGLQKVVPKAPKAVKEYTTSMALGAGAGAAQPAKTLKERVENTAIGIGTFGLAHGITKAATPKRKIIPVSGIRQGADVDMELSKALNAGNQGGFNERKTAENWQEDQGGLSSSGNGQGQSGAPASGQGYAYGGGDADTGLLQGGRGQRGQGQVDPGEPSQAPSLVDRLLGKLNTQGGQIEMADLPGAEVKVLINPTRDQLHGWLSKMAAKYDKLTDEGNGPVEKGGPYLRWLKGEDGTVYAWDAYEAAHEEIARFFGTHSKLKDYGYISTPEEADKILGGTGTGIGAKLKDETGLFAPFGGDIRQRRGEFSDLGDRKARIEIDDSGAKLLLDAHDVTPGVLGRWIKLSDVLDHPALYEKYPELANVHLYIKDDLSTGATAGIRVDPDTGEHLGEAISIGAGNWIKGSGIMGEKRDPLSSLLHEVQHILQRKGGFATGGSPFTIGQRLQDVRDELMEQIRRVNVYLEDTTIHGTPLYDRLLADRQTLVDQYQDLADQYGDVWPKAFDMYRHIGGEEEARRTGARADMTAKERIGHPYDRSDIDDPENLSYDTTAPEVQGLFAPSDGNTRKEKLPRPNLKMPQEAPKFAPQEAISPEPMLPPSQEILPTETAPGEMPAAAADRVFSPEQAIPVKKTASKDDGTTLYDITSVPALAVKEGAKLYSAVKKAVQESKQQKWGTGLEFIKWLQSQPGVTKDEVENLGLYELAGRKIQGASKPDDVLGIFDPSDGKPKPVTKDEVLKLIEQNEVKPEDVMFGGPQKPNKVIEFEQAGPNKWTYYDPSHGFYVVEDTGREGNARFEVMPPPSIDPYHTPYHASSLEIAKEVIRQHDEVYNPSTTRQPQYNRDSLNEPGGHPGSYRELFVTMPGSASGYKVVPAPDGDGFFIQRPDGKYVGGNGVDRDHEGTLDNHLARRWETKDDAERYGLTYHDETKWIDGHGGYEKVKNPVVRIRFDERTLPGPKLKVQPEQIGQLMREGQIVYYAYDSEGKYHEASDPAKLAEDLGPRQQTSTIERMAVEKVKVDTVKLTPYVTGNEAPNNRRTQRTIHYVVTGYRDGAQVFQSEKLSSAGVRETIGDIEFADELLRLVKQEMGGGYSGATGSGEKTPVALWKEVTLRSIPRNQSAGAAPTAPSKRILFIQEMQGPNLTHEKDVPEYLHKRIYDIGAKRMLAYAKENGYDGVAWTTGEMQAKRYGLERLVRDIMWKTRTYYADEKQSSMDNEEVSAGLKERNPQLYQAIEDEIKEYYRHRPYLGIDTRLNAVTPDAVGAVYRRIVIGDWDAPGLEEEVRQDFVSQGGAALSSIMVDINTKEHGLYTLKVDPKTQKIVQGEWTGHTLDEVLPKEIVNQILSKEKGKVEKEGLKVGGEGLKKLYDKDLPAIFEKHGKVKGGMIELPMGGKKKAVPFVPITQKTPESYTLYDITSLPSLAFKEARKLVHGIAGEVYEAGMKYKEFVTAMKEKAGEFWTHVQPHLESAWKAAKKAYEQSPLGNERGSVSNRPKLEAKYPQFAEQIKAMRQELEDSPMTQTLRAAAPEKTVKQMIDQFIENQITKALQAQEEDARARKEMNIKTPLDEWRYGLKQAIDNAVKQAMADGVEPKMPQWFKAQAKLEKEQAKKLTVYPGINPLDEAKKMTPQRTGEPEPLYQQSFKDLEEKPKKGGPPTSYQKWNNLHKFVKAGKLVDKKGDPIRFFTGTTADFDEFKPEFVGSHSGAEDTKQGEAYFFTNKAKGANKYAMGTQQRFNHNGEAEAWPFKDFGHKNVMPVYIGPQKPLFLAADGGGLDPTELQVIIRVARDKGYDAIIVGDKRVLTDNIGVSPQNTMRPPLKQARSQEEFVKMVLWDLDHNFIPPEEVHINPRYNVSDLNVIALKPNIIKSATGNKGTYSRRSKNILKALPLGLGVAAAAEEERRKRRQ